MGQIVLLVVAAAWAAVLVPPLLRSRVENRPNSSVSDFRSQLSSLQRVLPSRGASVRSMARPLAPSTLARPAASGRPPLRSGLGSNHTAQPAPAARTTSRDATRGHEPTARPRRHAERPERAPVVMRNGRPVLDAAEIKRRRTKVLYLIAGTAGVSGLMAATTDSKAMVYLFAVAVVALGAYVYLLSIANQRSLVDGADYADERDARDLYEAPPASRRSYRYDDDSDTYYGADTRALGRDPRRFGRIPLDRPLRRAVGGRRHRRPHAGHGHLRSHLLRASPGAAAGSLRRLRLRDLRPFRARASPAGAQRPSPHGSAPGGAAAA